ncbi:MAG: HlyC/CorC family transporter [Roseibium sp.]|nr:HlyC/CorC family transporter [Roseibium sp.]
MNTTNAVKTENDAEAGSPSSGVSQDADDPQQRRPQGSAALWTKLKRLLGFNRGANLRENLEDELARESGDATFSPEERLLLGNILRLRELRVDDVMIPRANIDAVESSITLGRVMDIFRESGHSRMPVYEDTLDDPRGMVHIKDLMSYIAECGGNCAPPARTNGAGGGPALTGKEDLDVDPASEPNGDALPPKDHNRRPIDLGLVDLSARLKDTGLVRDLLFVPPSMPATDLMAKMQAGRIQMALVIDEYGGTDGLVSLEDLVEEVVGDIEDEHDEDEEAMLAPVSDGIWIADPRLPLEDLDKALGTDLAAGEITEDVDTLGGLLYVTAGHVPVRGELLFVPDIPGFEFEILDADPRRIKRLRVRRRRPEVRVSDLRRRLKRAETAPGTDTAGANEPSADNAPGAASQGAPRP